MGNSVSMSNLSEDVPFIKPTMADIEKKLQNSEMDEILADYTKVLGEIVKMCEDPLTTKTEIMEESAKVFHEFHLTIKVMYNIMLEQEPEDEEDKQNVAEYRKTFGNLITFLDGYSSDFTKLMMRNYEMKKLEGLAEQVKKSIDKMTKGIEDVGKAMGRLGDTLQECEYEFVIPFFINNMVKDPKFKGRSDERLLLALNDDRNYFRALDLSKKPEKDLTDGDKQFMKLFLRRTFTF